jgi:putative aldouronate transport system substrate-binding protein
LIYIEAVKEYPDRAAQRHIHELPAHRAAQQALYKLEEDITMITTTASRLLGSTVAMALILSGCTQPAGKSTATETASVDSNGREMIGNMYKTGLPIVKDKITLKVAVHRPSYNVPYGDQKILKELEEKTNIHIEWIEYPTDSIKEKVGVMLASADFPDIAWRIDMTDKQMMDYGQSGAILKLNDLIDKWAPNWKELFQKEPYIKKVAAAQDGSIYSLPYVHMGEAEKGIRDAWVVNKTWLDKLGLKAPTTTEELRTVLKAFKEKDPNGNGLADEIPWTFLFDKYSNGHFDIFGSFGMLDFSNHIGLQDGKVIYTATDPRFKETIKFMNSLYKDGLIDPEAFTQNVSQFRAKLGSKTEIVGSAPVFNGSVEFGEQKMLSSGYVAMQPVKGPGVDKPLWRTQTNTVNRGYFTIFNTNKYPEISMRLADELVKAEFSISAHYGIKGVHWMEGADGKIDFPPNAFELASKENIQNFGPFAMTKDIMSRVKYTGIDKLRSDFFQFYKPYTVPVKDLYPPVMMSKEQLDQLSRYETDLNEFVKQKQAKWIVQGGIDEEWDAFVKKVNELKVDEVLKVYTQAYEAFNKN